MVSGLRNGSPAEEDLAPICVLVQRVFNMVLFNFAEHRIVEVEPHVQLLPWFDLAWRAGWKSARAGATDRGSGAGR